MPILKDNIIGNIITATKLQTARTINGVPFDGTSNITINIEDKIGSPIASATNINIGSIGLGDYIHITGTTTITSFGVAGNAGVKRTLIFDSALTINHNASSLICPGGTNITTIAGTIIELVAESTNSWRVTNISHPNISMLKLNYLSDVTANIQSQFSQKVSKIISVDNSVPRFDGSGGDIQGSSVKISDTGTLTTIGSGNEYYTAGIEILGNGSANTVYPAIGFNQPGLYASTIQLRAGGDFRFYTQGLNSYANITAGNITAYKNIDNGNEVVIANGFVGGSLNLNYRGSSSATTEIKVCNGLGNGGLAQITASQFNGSLNGNSSTTTKLQTSRLINGVSFDGTADIYVNNNELKGNNYISTGSEKPNNVIFGPGKLRYQMLSSSNLGTGVGSWNDVIWVSSYTGSDVKGSNALIMSKDSDYIGVSRSNYDATVWSAPKQLAYTSSNITGNAASATLASKASTLSAGGANGTAMTFNWSGQAGMPAWIWGGTDGVNMYVYDPTKFNVSTAVTLSGDESNWSNNRSRAVANMLGWKNYGNNHVIFDASAGTTPNGVSKNNKDPQIGWSPSYPTLMGWNGANTYGVRVDSARVADTVYRTLVASGNYNPGNFTGDNWFWFKTGVDSGSTYNTTTETGRYQLDLGIGGGAVYTYQYRIGLYYQLGTAAGYTSGSASDGGYAEGEIVAMIYVKSLYGNGYVTGGINWKLYKI